MVKHTTRMNLTKVMKAKIEGKLIWAGMVVPEPKILNVFTTNRCNFSCFYCSRNVKDNATGSDNRYRDKADFRFEDLRFLIDKYPGIEHVSFVGIGEPFLNEDLIPMALMAKKRGKKVSVITNASMLHNYWGKIAPSFDHISISLHGMNAEEINLISRVGEQVYNQFVENVRYLAIEERCLNPSMDIRASIVILKENRNQLWQAAQFCVDHSIPALDFQNYLPYGLDDFDLCIYDDNTDFVSYIYDLQSEYSGQVKINPPVFVKRDERKLKWRCMSFFSTLRVDGLGQVSGCSRIMVPTAENGNIYQDADIWQNDYFTNMRDKFRTGKILPVSCRYCPEAQ